ncbi:hypothetical protein [Baekduia sp.]
MASISSAPDPDIMGSRYVPPSANAWVTSARRRSGTASFQAEM